MSTKTLHTPSPPPQAHEGAPSVFAYLDFRAFLRDHYAYQKDRGRGFSYRVFARRAGFSSPNFLKLVIQGERNLSEAMAVRFAEACGLASVDQRYFVTLVHFAQSKNHEEKSVYYRKLLTQKRHQGIGQIEAEQYRYFSQWYLPAIRELSSRPDFRTDPEWISKELWPSVPVADVKRALRTLTALQLLQTDDEGDQPKTSLLSTSQETGSVLIAAYHREMVRCAVESIDIIPPAQRDLSALILCLGPEGIAQLKERVQKFRRELLELSVLEKHPQQVVQLNFQLFPLTRGSEIEPCTAGAESEANEGADDAS